ncbi:hypothetical protein VdG1_04330 [Verticillium dahliae VDG1]|nr:hypothetical protein VdG1_04330 [Verticillium dahliae VDG1]
MAEAKTHAEALLPRFKLERLLNQDQAGRRSSLLGSIDDKPALLILERAPFPVSTAYLGETPAALSSLKNLGANDIYFWFLARSGIVPSTPADDADADFFADLKINLIYPCTSTHVAKYSKQPAVGYESIMETLGAMDASDEEAGMDRLALSYTLGEASELWTEIFAPLRPAVRQRPPPAHPQPPRPAAGTSSQSL